MGHSANRPRYIPEGRQWDCNTERLQILYLCDLHKKPVFYHCLSPSWCLLKEVSLHAI